jgi:hypothetical protein
MAYGFQQLDSSGNIIIDTSTAVQTLIKIDSITVTLYKNASFGATTFDYSLPGVSSQTDLDDNYVFAQTNAGEWNLFTAGGPSSSFGRTYVSSGIMRFSGGGACYTLGVFGGSTARACTNLDIVAENYDIYVIGKTI